MYVSVFIQTKEKTLILFPSAALDTKSVPLTSIPDFPTSRLTAQIMTFYILLTTCVRESDLQF